MNSKNKLKQHIAEKYWLDILKKTDTVDFKSFSSTSEIILSQEKLKFFNKITSGKEIVEFTAIFGVYSALLKRYFTECNLVFSPNTLQYAEITKEVPLFYKTSAIDELTIIDYLKISKHEVQEVFKHADYDVDALQNKLDKSLGSFSPYGLIYNMEPLDAYDFPFMLNIQKNDTDFYMKLFFSEEFIDEELADQFLNTFRNWIENLEAYVNRKISEIPVVSEIEKTRLLRDFNDYTFNFPVDKTIVDLFEDQVRSTPDARAVYINQGSLTYRELNEKVNRLANYLKNEHRVGSGDIIGVLQSKSDKALITILAILKTGAAFLPIDIKYPEERINYIVNNSQLGLIMTAGGINRSIEKEIIDIETLDLSETSIDNLEIEITPTDIAYVIYTSGSTGNPKGVPIAHTSNVNMSLQQIKVFEVTSTDTVVWFASIAFDASVSEIMMAFYCGACLSIPEQDDIADTDKFIKFLKASGTTIATFPPSYLDLLDNKSLLQLKSIITAGEPAHPQKALQIINQGINYYNAYGPTECAVCVSMYKVSQKDKEKSFIPIGNPIANLPVYVLDQNLEPVPVGVPGILYVSGIGLSKGYLHRPELTEERFIANPFVENTKMYDTGDLVSWLPDGNLKYIGRKDKQVKIRGHRVELGEIENTILQRFKEVKQVAVTVKKIKQEGTLVAYHTFGIDSDSIRKYLEQTLPPYMVPSYFTTISKLPLTTNGKIDYKALPDVTILDVKREEYIAPRTNLEKEMVAMWEEVIGIQNIGIRDNFFALGGHSLKVTQLLNKLRHRLGYQIKIRDFFTNPTIEKSLTVIQKTANASIPKVLDQIEFPLTPSQNRLWVLSQFEGGNTAYNIPIITELNGRININALNDSIKYLINRHESLRTAFITSKTGETIQKVDDIDQINFELDYKDITSDANHEEFVSKEIHDIYGYEFDLSKGNLLNAKLVKLSQDKHLFIFCIHHIIGDGWSMQLFIKELGTIYNALVKSDKLVLPELPIQYNDYAIWLSKELKKESFIEKGKYWKEKMSGELPVLQLPSYSSRPKIKTYNGASIDIEFSKEFYSVVETFKVKNETTLFAVLMAGINGLFYRYTDHRDIILGTVVAGREHQDLENQIGLYLNTLAIRTQFEDAQTFQELITVQKETLRDAFSHQEYPFDLLVEQLEVTRNSTRSALFDVMVVLQNQQDIVDIRSVKFEDLDIKPYSNTNTTSSKFDMTFSFIEEDSKIKLNLEYNTDIYELSTINNLLAHFEKFVITAIQNQEKQLDEIDFLIETEKEEIITKFNDTKVLYPEDKTITELFVEQAIKTPDQVALIYKNKRFTYKELDEASTQLAIYLSENYPIEKEDFIGVSLSQSEYLIISILAILKVGCAYVPIDKGYPKERKKYIVNDSACFFVIDDDFVNNYLNREIVGSKLPEFNCTSQNAAYIIYTSGSTGKPKGVIVEHQSVIRLVKPCSYFPLDESHTLLSTGSISFDATIIEYFGSLLNGATLVLADKEDLLDTNQLEYIIKKEGVDCLWMTASWFKQVVESKITVFDTINKLIVGGDVVSPFHTSKLLQKNPELKIVNGYGPTENTTFSVTFPIEDKAYTSIPIGKPIDNSSAYILNGKQKIVPIGVVGELYLAGDGLAREYLNQPELTKEKFVPNPFVKGKRMYKTGDLARWLPDGNIEFLGRKDTQFKIRGYRIEIGEIEHALLQQESISQTFVKVEEVNGVKSIIAYVVSNIDFDKKKIRHSLLNFLPEYMIPSYYIFMDTLPLTDNGKTDVRALPKVTEKDSIQKKYVAPTNQIEQSIADIWQQVLLVEKIGVSDNFFELGGNSLQAIKILNTINNQFEDIEFSAKEFFQYQTIKEFAQLLSFKTYNNQVQDQQVDAEYEEITL